MRSPTVLATLALLAIPVALLIEKTAPEVWRERLAVPRFEEQVNRHTPLQTDGIVLPPQITKNLTLAADQNPVILAGRSEVAPGVTLTINPGTHLYAHEFAELSVLGTLRLQGTETQPITLTTNERHPVNQLWNGIIVRDGGSADITHAEFHYASPALTCEKGASGSLTQSEIHEALVGVYSESVNCILNNNRIQAIQKEVVSNFQ